MRLKTDSILVINSVLKYSFFRSEFLQQNIESRKLFDEMEERLSLLQNQSEMFGIEQNEGVTIKSDSWEFKEKIPGNYTYEQDTQEYMKEEGKVLSCPFYESMSQAPVQ